MNQFSIKVSVIMACHNAAAYLDEAINSVLDQQLIDLELIIIDDCSMDNSLEIAKRYQMQDYRVSVLSLPENCGPAIARNAGICNAQGEWLGILDSDDVALPSRFEDQMRLADSDKNLVMIGGNSVSIDTKGNVIKMHKYPTSHSPLVRRLEYMQAFPPHSSLTYRKDAVLQLSGFNKRYPPSEDYDLWLRLSEIGRVASIGKPLIKIRKHAQNISNTEGGRRQTRFGLAAAVCHFLRGSNFPDPSTADDDAAWEKFITWIDRKMEKSGIFERQKAWASARSEYLAAGNMMSGTFRFGNRFLQSGHAMALVWGKFFGTTLPQRLAEEWVCKSCSVLFS